MRFVFASEFSGPKWEALGGYPHVSVLVSYWFSLERDASRGVPGLIKALGMSKAHGKGNSQ